MLLERICHASGPVFYVSPQLRAIGVPHAFSTRQGGLSPAPFDSLNLGNPNGDVRDDRARILENYTLLERATNLVGRERCWLQQVHGNVVKSVKSRTPHDNAMQGDALVTGDSGRALSVRVADCCPVLVASDDGHHVAAIHSGWRGVIAGVAVKAMEALLGQRISIGLDASPQKIFAAIGPCIGFDAFEVGPEVLAEFERVFSGDAPIRTLPDGKGHADIREGIRISLLRAGVPARNIDTTDACTHRDAGEFFSHRRDKGVTGRMAALIAVKR